MIVLKEWSVLWTAAARSGFALEDAVIVPQGHVSVALEDSTWTLPHHNACLVDIIARHAAAQHVQAVFLTLTLLPIILACDVIPSASLAAALQPPAPNVLQESHLLLVSATLLAPKTAFLAAAPLV